MLSTFTQCLKLKKQANESDFPHLYNPKKSGQLAGLVNSPPRSSRQTSRGSSRAASKGPSQSMPPPPIRQPSKVSPPPAPAVEEEEEEAMRVDEEPALPFETAAAPEVHDVMVGDTTTEAITELEYLSPPNSRQPDTRPTSPSQHNAAFNKDDAEEPATSSSPKLPPAPIDPDTSSDPVDELPAPASVPRQGNLLLKEQTSALLLSLESAPLEDPAAKRKARIGRKRVRSLPFPNLRPSCSHIFLATRARPTASRIATPRITSSSLHRPTFPVASPAEASNPRNTLKRRTTASTSPMRIRPPFLRVNRSSPCSRMEVDPSERQW